jgi:hypothetical protein
MRGIPRVLPAAMRFDVDRRKRCHVPVLRREHEFDGRQLFAVESVHSSTPCLGLASVIAIGFTAS